MVHHPTVLAAYAEGRGWKFAGDAEVKSKFWGRSIELTPIGLLTLSFQDGDVYTWNKASILPSLRTAPFVPCPCCAATPQLLSAAALSGQPGVRGWTAC